MSDPLFPDKSRRPTADELTDALGEAAPLLQSIETYLEAGGHSPGREWKFYTKKAGWTLAVRSKKRNVFHLSPHEGSFTVVFTFGQRAVDACRDADLPESISTLIEGARVYAEGRSFQFTVSSPADVSNVEKLITIKLAH